MINCAKGKVKDIIQKQHNCTRVKVIIDKKQYDAINYDSLTGNIQIGDSVLLNTTAVDLKLGSGGYHFVISINGKKAEYQATNSGHIMRLRYTPLQFAVLSVEEQQSPFHNVFNDFKNLNGMPVIIGELHSMVAPAIFNIKRNQPNFFISYIMTDGGALPMSFSKIVTYLKEKKLVEKTITYGQAFGGDFEAVNIYSALITAYEILRSDIAVITMGPGITGTETKYGFSGIDQGPIIDAVNTLGGRPIFIPRISFGDKRKRHRGISHHSVTILKEIAKTSAEVVIPIIGKKELGYVINQIIENGIHKKHTVIFLNKCQEVLKNLLHFDFKFSTMGRHIGRERDFFITAGSAGYYASSSKHPPTK